MVEFDPYAFDHADLPEPLDEPDVATAEAARRVAERVRGAVNCDLRCNGELVAVRASVGLAFSHQPITADELIAAADQAMYEAKQDETQQRARSKPG